MRPLWSGAFRIRSDMPAREFCHPAPYHVGGTKGQPRAAGDKGYSEEDDHWRYRSFEAEEEEEAGRACQARG